MVYESESSEWKRSWSDKCYKTLAAFSNGRGGTTIIGKDDDGRYMV
ncbi:MAG: ATP-binding protein [Methanomassiliicoccaceae archaeon]|nr:ATP-binding protein [Methanomassiliicoccaceae archaeon]